MMGTNYDIIFLILQKMIGPLQQFDYKISNLNESKDFLRLGILRKWLLHNLVTKKWNLQRDGTFVQKFKFLHRDYEGKSTSYNLSEEQVCKRFGISSSLKYKGYNEQGEPDDVGILKSFELQSLFKEAVMPNPDNHDAVDASFDTKRFAIYEEDLIQHPKYNDIGPTIETLREKVIQVAKTKDSRISYSVFTVLFSSAGGEIQDLHVDEIRRVSKNEAIHSAIVALEPNGSMLDLSVSINDHNQRYQVPIQFGFMILFHGFQSHGGSAYSQPNIRFHFYLHHEESALEPFKRNARATVLECEACSEEDSTPLNCGMKFRNNWHRANHYRLEHAMWWEYHQDCRKWWNSIARKKKQVIYNKNWRAKKREEMMENEE